MQAYHQSQVQQADGLLTQKQPKKPSANPQKQDEILNKALRFLGKTLNYMLE